MHRWTMFTGLALAGVLAGVAAKAADESTISWASDLGTFPAVWVLTIALIGRFAPTALWATARASAFVVGMVTAYYAWSSLVLGFAMDRWILVWTVLSVTAVPVLAVAVWWAAPRTGPVAASVMAGMAGLVLADGIVAQMWLALIGDLPPDFPLRPFQAVVNLVAALLIAGALPGQRSTRIGAIALAPVMALVAGMFIDEVAGRLIY